MHESGYPRPSFRPTLADVLPETLEEAAQIAASIERAVNEYTGGAVRNLRVEVCVDRVLLRGFCQTYYCKQLAQHAAMGIPGGRVLDNEIEVG